MPVANSCRYWKDIVVNMENNTRKLDAALEFALQVLNQVKMEVPRLDITQKKTDGV